jgi:SAM-dependent methyltransferase
MTTIDAPQEAAEAYDCLAPYYDSFTDGYAHDAWIEGVERAAFALGLRGKRALDLGCGTGKSTAPLIARGYSVLSCDVSPAMIAEARRKFPQDADRFFVADMRELPAIGEFDLVLCVDDALNYLLSERELQETFSGVADVLTPGGMFVFDLNSLSTYGRSFAEDAVSEQRGLLFAWRGQSDEPALPGSIFAADVEVFSEREDGLWERRTSRHLQRHHPPAVVGEALEQAGLECRAVRGQLPGAIFEDCADEDLHTKLVYFTRKIGFPGHEGR